MRIDNDESAQDLEFETVVYVEKANSEKKEVKIKWKYLVEQRWYTTV